MPEVIGPAEQNVTESQTGNLTLVCTIDGADSYTWTKLGYTTMVLGTGKLMAVRYDSFNCYAVLQTVSFILIAGI